MTNITTVIAVAILIIVILAGYLFNDMMAITAGGFLLLATIIDGK